ncbi:MAG: peptide ABC transporter substrate-binding protein [Christensenellaceae bacterium]|jgi:oligopeptide transport system substrate-binding protein|nr:peptide ABC transporter substrate-binding protein [Christensenellaceae bacterium]
MTRFAKTLSVFLALALVALGLAACGGSQAPISTGSSNPGGAATPAAGTEKGIIIRMEPETGTLDPAGNSSTTYWNYSAYALAPLVELASDGSYDFIIAESCDINEDNTVFTFHFREGAAWSDGSPCTPADYINTMQRALDPACGSGYSDFLFKIKNGKAIYEGSADISTLGVEAPDDKTLVITLEEPCQYFLDLLFLPVFYPSHAELATETNGDWCFDPARSVANGPFYLAEYVPEQYILLKKNPYYVQKDRISLDYIKLLAIADTQSAISAYKTGEVDLTGADYTVLAEYEGKGDLVVLPGMTTYYTLLNWDREPLSNPLVREALSLAIDRDAIAASAGKGSYEPTSFFVAKYMTSKLTGQGKKWGEEVDPLVTLNIERAQQLLAEAGFPNGEGFPELSFKYPAMEVEAAIAQSLQAQWKQNLGIMVSLESQEYQVNISDRRAGDFDICRMRWTADYADPTTFLSMYTGSASYNDSGVASAKYEELLALSERESDPAKRFQILHDAEKALVAEDFAFIPTLAGIGVTLRNPKIGNIVINPSRNSPFYKYATLAD